MQEARALVEADIGIQAERVEVSTLLPEVRNRQEGRDGPTLSSASSSHREARLSEDLDELWPW